MDLSYMIPPTQVILVILWPMPCSANLDCSTITVWAGAFILISANTTLA